MPSTGEFNAENVVARRGPGNPNFSNGNNPGGVKGRKKYRLQGLPAICRKVQLAAARLYGIDHKDIPANPAEYLTFIVAGMWPPGHPQYNLQRRFYGKMEPPLGEHEIYEPVPISLRQEAKIALMRFCYPSLSSKEVSGPEGQALPDHSVNIIAVMSDPALRKRWEDLQLEMVAHQRLPARPVVDVTAEPITEQDAR